MAIIKNKQFLLQVGFGPGILTYPNKQIIGPSFHPRKFANKVNNWYNNRVLIPRAERLFEITIANAINLGYVFIDYSCSYGDGKLLGRGIRRSQKNRDSLTITSRVSNYAQLNHCVRKEFLMFLHNTGLEYVDILQFHWPVTDHYLDTWKEMEALHEEGYVKHLGVANCHQHHLEEIFSICKYKPEIGQFEIHPLFTQKPLIEYYKQHDIQVCAYTPIARFDDRLMRLPVLKRIGDRYGKSVTQVILRWHIQNGIIPIIRTLSKLHQKENLNIFDFNLSKEEMRLIDGININSRLRYDPDNCDFNII